MAFINPYSFQPAYGLPTSQPQHNPGVAPGGTSSGLPQMGGGQADLGLANSIGLGGGQGGQGGIFGIMLQMLQLMTQLLQQYMGGQQPTPQPQPGPYPNPGPGPIPGPGPGPIPGPGPGPMPGPGPGPMPGPGPQPGVVQPNGPLNSNDLLNYVLGGSKGGTVNPDGSINSLGMQQDSRFANAGQNEFDAAVAQAYTLQFKGHAMGLDTVFTPGQNTPQEIANNLATASKQQFTPEAELLSKVAATYRGDLSGVGAYDNGKLKDLLVSWGRQDLAGQPSVGQTDIESIGSVVRALNEQQDPAIRKQWLNQIYSFDNNNNPSSPSGAVPDLAKYQKAVNVVRDGTYDKLLDNYNKGIKTNGPVGIDPTVPPATPDIDRNIDFSKLNTQQRSELGLNDRDRAVLHLWGRQMISAGKNNGDIYQNILAGQGTPEELKLVNELMAKEKASQNGVVNGSALDQEFFALNQRITGKDISARYANRPPNEATTGQPLNLISDLSTLQQRTGLSAEDQAVLRLWGHEPLMNGGKIDGSILAYTVGNANSLDSNAHTSNAGSNIDAFAEALLKSDLASDGVRNGDSLGVGFTQVLDKLYLGGPGVNLNQIQTDAVAKGQQNGFSMQQIGQNMQQGITQAMADAASFVKDHPVISATAGVGLGAAAAICPFLGGMAVAGAGVAMGQNMMNGQQTQAA